MNALALLIGAALIAGAIAVSHRYVIVAHSCGEGCSQAWWIDQWTGHPAFCESSGAVKLGIGGNAACLTVGGLRP